MKIVDIRLTGLTGGTVDGGWPEDFKPEDAMFKGMKYRVIGPFRGGRSLSASGIAGDPTTYYFGSTGGGVWKSTDGAMTWSPVFDKQGTSSIGSLAVAPSDRAAAATPTTSWYIVSVSTPSRSTMSTASPYRFVTTKPARVDSDRRPAMR